MIPLMLDLSTSRILVIGTGAVGQRKAEYFAGQCKEIVLSDTAPEDISGFDIIIAATASAGENERICLAAASQNKLYNSATGIGNFLIPAAVFEENYTLAVSTNGKAPAAAAYLRDKIETDLPSFSKMVELQEILRAELKNSACARNIRYSFGYIACGAAFRRCNGELLFFEKRNDSFFNAFGINSVNVTAYS